jgi:hypothetical protein
MCTMIQRLFVASEEANLFGRRVVIKKFYVFAVAHKLNELGPRIRVKELIIVAAEAMYSSVLRKG